MKLYTIGYERAGQLSLIDRLREAGVARVIDVRELPNSRRAGGREGELRPGAYGWMTTLMQPSFLSRKVS